MPRAMLSPFRLRSDARGTAEEIFGARGPRKLPGSAAIDHGRHFAPGKAGVIFWTDILIPIIGFVLLWLQHRYERMPAAVAFVRL